MEWVSPIIAGAFALITAITAGIIAKRASKANLKEDRAPDVTDSWHEADRARRLFYNVLDMFYAIRSAFRSYTLRVQQGGSTELTTSEAKAFELEPPTIDPTKEK